MQENRNSNRRNDMNRNYRDSNNRRGSNINRRSTSVNRRSQIDQERMYGRKNNRNPREDQKNNKIEIGTMKGFIAMIQELAREIKSSNKGSKGKKRKRTKEDKLAMVLTAIVMIVLGVILWFIPATNGWMRELTVDNPLIGWMFK